MPLVLNSHFPPPGFATVLLGSPALCAAARPPPVGTLLPHMDLLVVLGGQIHQLTLQLCQLFSILET
jgi:hypothetical protein